MDVQRRVLYNRLPIDYINQELSPEHVAALTKACVGEILFITTEIVYIHQIQGVISETVAYVANVDDGIVSRVNPTELTFID